MDELTFFQKEQEIKAKDEATRDQIIAAENDYQDWVEWNVNREYACNWLRDV